MLNIQRWMQSGDISALRNVHKLFFPKQKQHKQASKQIKVQISKLRNSLPWILHHLHRNARRDHKELGL